MNYKIYLSRLINIYKNEETLFCSDCIYEHTCNGCSIPCIDEILIEIDEKTLCVCLKYKENTVEYEYVDHYFFSIERRFILYQIAYINMLLKQIL